MWDVWWTKCYVERPFPGYFCFPLSVSFRQYSTFIFISILNLTEQTGEVWEPSNGEVRILLRNSGSMVRKHFIYLFIFFVIPRFRIFTFLSLEDWLWGQHSLIPKEYRVLPTRYKATHGDNDCSLPLNGGTSKQLIHEQNVCIKGRSVFMGGVSSPSASLRARVCVTHYLHTWMLMLRIEPRSFRP